MSISEQRLHHYLRSAALQSGSRPYIKTTERSYTFLEIEELANDFIRFFTALNLKAGQCVVIYSSKNAASIAAMNACSSMGLIYVPVSSLNPAQRAQYIIEETQCRIVLANDACAQALYENELPECDFKAGELSAFLLNDDIPPKASDPTTAFILYTSGSTGVPKGVAISHQAAMTFIEWGVTTFRVSENDKLTSIAPFNFDLSVFDVYVSVAAKATLLLYTESETKNALLMGKRIAEDGATVIYGTPTFLATLAYFGKLQKYEFGSLRTVLFAGEVFPPENYSALRQHWPHSAYYNLYGPTETNVCTFYKVGSGNLEEKAFPIGRCCDYASALILDEEDKVIESADQNGELLIAGNSLFNAYWNDAIRTKRSLFRHRDGSTYYRTGDIVYRNSEGDLVYSGRKDRMIKKHGFRIEPQEVEDALLKQEGASTAAVLFDKSSNKLVGFIRVDRPEEQQVSAWRKHCMEHLPAYMVPDKFVFLEQMPETTSGKVNLQALKELL